jgi:hypothetical protein
MITFHRFLTIVYKMYPDVHPGQRLGQYVMTVLSLFNGPLYETIVGTTVDPYDNDNRLEAFWEFVSSNWDNPACDSPMSRAGN